MGPAARKYVPREPHCQPHRTPYSSAAKLSGLGEGTGFSGASPSRRTDFRVTRVQSLNPPRNSWSLGFSLGLKVRILLRLRPRESTRSAGSAAESPQSGRHLLHYNSYLLRNDHGQGRKRQKPSWGRKAAATGADIAGRGLSHTFSHEPRVGGGADPPVVTVLGAPYPRSPVPGPSCSTSQHLLAQVLPSLRSMCPSGHSQTKDLSVLTQEYSQPWWLSKQ